MKMAENNIPVEPDLDDLLAAEAANPAKASAALLDRVIADADIIADGRARMTHPDNLAPRAGLMDSLLAAIGGWPGVGGLATATVVGIWIGFAPPAAIDDLAGSYLANNDSYGFGDLMPSIDGFLDEG